MNRIPCLLTTLIAACALSSGGLYAVKMKPESAGYPTEFHVTTGSLGLSVQPGEMGALSAVQIEAKNEKANE